MISRTVPVIPGRSGTMPTMQKTRVGAAVLGLSLAGMFAHGAEPIGRDGPKFFRERIEPILVSECYRCHSAEAKKVRGRSQTRLRTAMLKGGETGPALVPGKAGESLIVQALRHQDGLEMPPQKPRLPASVIADFETWITIGTPGPMDDDSAKTGDLLNEAQTALGVSAIHESDSSNCQGSLRSEEPG